uniref:AGC-kinase C-terminal domain-containing protein n=1 Tax=Globisporangium ultimum (strain ATCC 200006 / CBS 805.95 / DAOM BR144) TaxID=431595 RepID=K3WFE0_GLOUD
MISAAAPVVPPREQTKYTLDDFELLATLGCLRGGSDDVKKHRYFSRVDWDAVFNRTETPPYLPHVGGPGDHQNFDEYPDSPMDDSVVLFGEDKAAFEVFDHF